MLCINTFGRVRYFPDQAKKKIQNGRTSTLSDGTQKTGFLATERVKGSAIFNAYGFVPSPIFRLKLIL